MTGSDPDDTAPIDPAAGPPGSSGPSGSEGWPSYQPPDPTDPTDGGRSGEPGPSGSGSGADRGSGWGQPTPPDPYGSTQSPPPLPAYQQPYQQSAYPPYGADQPAFGGYAPAVPNQPQATTAMVLGIISLAGGLLCVLPILLGPVALILGYRSRKEIEASQGRLGGSGSATAGLVLGIISSVLLVLGILLIVLIVGLAGAASPGT